MESRVPLRLAVQGGHSPSSTPPANTLCSLQWFQALPAARPADGSTSQSTRAPCNHFRQGACRCHRASIGTAKRRRIGLDATNVVACLQKSAISYCWSKWATLKRRCRRVTSSRSTMERAARLAQHFVAEQVGVEP